MKKSVKIFMVFFVLSGCSVNANNQPKKVVNDVPQIIERVQTEKGVCEITRVKKVISGNSMTPILQDGGEINLLENYYKCGKELEKGDIVAYHYAGDDRPLIKIARVLPDDEVEIIEDKMMVNGAFLKNSADQEYSFSEGEVKMLALYIKNKRIPKNTCFLFGDNVDVSTDSRKFGAVSKNDFLGKFEID